MRLKHVINAVCWRASLLAIALWPIPLNLRSQTTNPANKTSACLPTFPYKNGWLGGDGGYSIALEAGKSLWLFGDSFVGKDSASTRSGTRFVRNTIALSACDQQNGWQITYYWGNQNQSTPSAFFDSRTTKYWYWPLDGFLYRDRLYVAIAKLKDKPSEKIFSFETVAVLLAKVSNLSAPPNQWKIEYRQLTEGPALYPGSTVVVDGLYAYFFTVHERPTHHGMILSRIPLDKLDEPAANLQYFAKDRSWKRGLNGADAYVVIETGHSEMSVRYHPETKQWMALTGGDFLSNKIMVRTAPDLTGPWSQGQAVHEFPEMNPKTDGHDPDTWCYAVKEHIEFASTNRLLVTYACNSFKLDKLVSNMSIYRPQAVSIEFPVKNN